MKAPHELSQERVEVIPPNHGSSIPDTEAVGKESESLSQWHQKMGIDLAHQIRLVKLAHMRYQHPDLDKITTFLLDFGMQVVKRTETQAWYRGYGPDAYVYYAQKGAKKFLGGAFEVESFGELERASQRFNVPIEELDGPGGGSIVTFPDPEGFPINLVCGQTSTPAPTASVPERLVVNDEIEKPRVRRFQRFQAGPAAVHKLGHFGLCVTKFEELMEFYTRNFNIAPTDFLYVEPHADGGGGGDGARKTVAMFAHLSRGPAGVDHHTFFLSAAAGRAHVHHCSFEVHDYDAQQLGHNWLARRGYDAVWGVGRHILGSQIFDYWWDPAGNMVEHYADGDVVNDDTPVGSMPARHESVAVWGPDMPKDFMG